jgi:hypothetical protein
MYLWEEAITNIKEGQADPRTTTLYLNVELPLHHDERLTDTSKDCTRALKSEYESDGDHLSVQPMNSDSHTILKCFKKELCWLRKKVSIQMR